MITIIIILHIIIICFLKHYLVYSNQKFKILSKTIDFVITFGEKKLGHTKEVEKRQKEIE